MWMLFLGVYAISVDTCELGKDKGLKNSLILVIALLEM